MNGCMFCLTLLLVFLVGGILAAADQKDLSSRIYGGKESSVDKLPYMASLQIFTIRWTFSHMCGLSIIDEYHLLTAAHCFHYSGNPIWYRVVVGQTDICKESTRFNIEFIKIHPNYDSHKVLNDIAVVKVKDRLPIGTSVRPIPLSSKQPEVGEMCTASGWGLTFNLPSITGQYDKGFKRPCVLREVQIPIVSSYNKYCYTADQRTQLCAGHTANSDTYQLEGLWKGDSGGPLVCNGEVKGIASYVITKEANQLPKDYATVFTNVMAFTQWLEQVIPRST